MMFNHINKKRAMSDIEINYGVAPKNLEYIPRGRTNSNYLVSFDDEVKFVLRVYPEEKTRKSIIFEGEVIENLESVGFPTAGHIFTKDSSVVSEIDGHLASLFIYMDGEVLESEDISMDMLGNIGRHEAWLHNIMKGFVPKQERAYSRFGNYRDSMDRFNYETYIKEKIIPEAIKRKVVDGIENISSEIIAEFDFLKSEITGERFANTPKGIIHGDMYSHNILFKKDGSISAIIDFDDCRKDAYCMELAISLLDLSIKNNMIDVERARKFIQSYNEERMLTDFEKNMLPKYTRLYSVFSAINVLNTISMHEGKDLSSFETDANLYFERMQNTRAIDDETWKKILNE